MAEQPTSETTPEKQNSAMYRFIKDFQSGLVGILGFIGVCLTIGLTAHFEEVHKINEQERTRIAVQSALHAELMSIHDELANILDIAETRDQGDIKFTLEDNYVFRALVKDVGLLEHRKAADTIRAYRDVYLIVSELRGLADDPQQKLVRVSKEHFPEIRESIERLKGELVSVIEELEDKAATPPTPAI
jgi:hypothetical protein